MLPLLMTQVNATDIDNVFKNKWYFKHLTLDPFTFTYLISFKIVLLINLTKKFLFSTSQSLACCSFSISIILIAPLRIALCFLLIFLTSFIVSGLASEI